MKRLPSMLLAALAGSPVLVQAHTHLKSSTPANGSVVSSSPGSIMLMFSEPTRVTALGLRSADAKEEQKLGPLPEKASAHVMVPAPKLQSGAYVVQWRAIGDDNHVMKGTIRFTVSADGPASAPKGDSSSMPEHTDPTGEQGKG
jgi:copper resistance protein C